MLFSCDRNDRLEVGVRGFELHMVFVTSCGTGGSSAGLLRQAAATGAEYGDESCPSTFMELVRVRECRAGPKGESSINRAVSWTANRRKPSQNVTLTSFFNAEKNVDENFA